MKSNKQKFIMQQLKDSITLKQQILESPILLDKIEAVSDLCIRQILSGSKIILSGNGGSAADAQHIAAEFVGRFKENRRALPAISLSTDTSIITAISNDYGYVNIFSRQIEAIGAKGDVFIGISTSGESKNIIKAVETSKERGIYTVVLCGISSSLQGACDFVLDVPSEYTDRIQEAHITIGHILCGIVEKAFIDF